MIELDRLRSDLIHGTPAEETAYPQLQPGAAVLQPWLATLAGAVLAGYGLTRPRGFLRIGFLSAAAGLVFRGWDRNRRSAASQSRAGGTSPATTNGPWVEWGGEHPVDVASQGSFPASDPPSLNPLA